MFKCSVQYCVFDKHEYDIYIGNHMECVCVCSGIFHRFFAASISSRNLQIYSNVTIHPVVACRARAFVYLKFIYLSQYTHIT